MKPSQVEKISKWIRETGIRWGIDPKQRTEILLRSHCKKGMVDKSSAGTWKMGVDRLLLGTAMILPSDLEERAHYTHRPLKEVNSTDQELLGTWSALISSLREDLKPLTEGSKKSLKEWSEYLLSLLYRYFSWSKSSDEEEAQANVLVKCIENLKISGTGKGDYYPFSTIIYHLKNALEQQEVHYRENHFQAVRFCSMLPMRAVPAKVVVMMGLSEENYPRKEERILLNKLYHEKGVDPFPSATEFDRYLFLEAVLSARQYILLSYHKKDQGKDSLHQCSLLISELVHYLDQSFSITGKKPSEHCVYEHPFSSFDKRYFQSEEKIKSYSLSDYRAALSYYKSQNKAPHRFIPSFSVREAKLEGSFSIDIREVRRLARNPVRFYFHKKLGIYLKEEEEIPTDESLTLSALDLSRFRKESGLVSLESILKGAELEGLIPVGPFKDLSISKIIKEVSDISEKMEEFAVNSDNLFEVILCETCQTPYYEDKRWFFPPLVVRSDDMNVILTGSLGECSSEGILIYKNGEKRTIAEVWPLFLIWCSILETHHFIFKKDVLFVRNGERWSAFFEDAQPYLRDYLAYYLSSVNDVSPLIPEWLETFVLGTKNDFKNAVHQSVSGDFFFNDEVIWLCREDNILQADDLFDHWTEKAKKIFLAPFKAWGGKKK